MVRNTSNKKSQKTSSRLTIRHHIVRHFHKHAHKIVSAYNHISHVVLHSGELIVVLVMGLSSFLFASWSGSVDAFMRSNDAEVATYLAQAIANPQNILSQGNLISVWKVPTNVYTSFTTGYCTYGAARISPEFFPYVDSSSQQRTWGGNAVDRCANAAATGYRISNTPKVGSLIVYDGGGKFGPYGHVGKVVYYDKGLNKVIVRDMARVSIFTMSDHRQDVSDQSIKCYIYNIRNTSISSDDDDAVTTGNSSPLGTPTSTNTLPAIPIGNVVSHSSAPTSEIQTPVSPSLPQQTPTIPVTTPTPSIPTSSSQTNTPTQTPASPSLPQQIPTLPNVSTTQEKDIDLDFSKLSDLGTFFVSQRDIKVHLSGQSPFHIGSQQILTIKITDKKTGEPLSGLMPLALEFINSQNTIGLDYSSIQLIQDGTFTLHISGDKLGSSALILTLGGEKIAKLSFTVEK